MCVSFLPIRELYRKGEGRNGLDDRQKWQRRERCEKLRVKGAMLNKRGVIRIIN